MIFASLLLLHSPGISTAQTALISIPNGSFESPSVPFVDVNVDSWQKSSKPAWYVESGGFLWSQLTGVFSNPAPGSFDRIENCDGAQALWLFAIPEVGLFQDYDSQDWNDSAPTREFDATYEIGKSYTLTAGVIGGGGGMSNGASIAISFYYRDTASNQVNVATTIVTHSPALFQNRTQFLDFQVRVPIVQATDPWAGQHIGIQLLSTVSTNLQGGYWDLDNFRLAGSSAPTLTGFMHTGGHVQFIVQGEPGRYEVLAGADPGVPVDDWASLGIVTNTTGNVLFTREETNLNQRFYQTRLLP